MSIASVLGVCISENVTRRRLLEMGLDYQSGDESKHDEERQGYRQNDGPTEMERRGGKRLFLEKNERAQKQCHNAS